MYLQFSHSILQIPFFPERLEVPKRKVSKQFISGIVYWDLSFFAIRWDLPGCHGIQRVQTTLEVHEVPMCIQVNVRSEYKNAECEISVHVIIITSDPRCPLFVGVFPSLPTGPWRREKRQQYRDISTANSFLFFGLTETNCAQILKNGSLGAVYTQFIVQMKCWLNMGTDSNWR